MSTKADVEVNCPPLPAEAEARFEEADSVTFLGRRRVFSILLSLAVFACLAWSALALHPDTVIVKKERGRFDSVSRIAAAINNARSDALSDVAVLRKIYTIPETDLVAPKPDRAAFGETDDTEVIQELIDRSAELLEGQELSWRADIERYSGSKIGYYCDDSILVLTWKEVRDGSMLTFAEVKIADGSQLRRALSGNSYGSGVRTKATDMASAVNAVIAINGDFYDFRQLGITAYQRKLYRDEKEKLDTAYFTPSGDIIFTHAGELSGKDTQEFLDNNDVLFAISFGPVLIENGELRHIDRYPIGEVNTTYSRSVIAQKDRLHYILMTVGEEGRYGSRATINQAAQYIYDKDVKSAYTLDGGQTAVIVMNGKTVNCVDWNNERTMSDIIYFATAIPEWEVEK